MVVWLGTKKSWTWASAFLEGDACTKHVCRTNQILPTRWHHLPAVSCILYISNQQSRYKPLQHIIRLRLVSFLVELVRRAKKVVARQSLQGNNEDAGPSSARLSTSDQITSRFVDPRGFYLLVLQMHVMPAVWLTTPLRMNRPNHSTESVAGAPSVSTFHQRRWWPWAAVLRTEMAESR